MHISSASPSFVVDGSGDLTRITTLELCVTSLRYDGSHRLKAMIIPGGQRQTLNYNGSGHVQAGVNPSVHRTTLA
jgi:YD repeat-containing protein